MPILAHAVKELYVEAGGAPLVTTASLKAADFTGNYLSGLSLTGVTLSPAFSSTVQTYTADVSASVTTSSMAAVKTYSGATVAMTVNGAAYAAGEFALREGDNLLRVNVTAFWRDTELSGDGEPSAAQHSGNHHR